MKISLSFHHTKLSKMLFKILKKRTSRRLYAILQKPTFIGLLHRFCSHCIENTLLNVKMLEAAAMRNKMNVEAMTEFTFIYHEVDF